jgi:hypothetical protein
LSIARFVYLLFVLLQQPFTHVLPIVLLLLLLLLMLLLLPLLLLLRALETECLVNMPVLSPRGKSGWCVVTTRRALG